MTWVISGTPKFFRWIRIRNKSFRIHTTGLKPWLGIQQQNIGSMRKNIFRGQTVLSEPIPVPGTYQEPFSP